MFKKYDPAETRGFQFEDVSETLEERGVSDYVRTVAEEALKKTRVREPLFFV
jgi:hypothetical protein